MFKSPFTDTLPARNPVLIHFANRMHARIDTMLKRDITSNSVSIRLEPSEQQLLAECVEDKTLSPDQNALAKKLISCVEHNRLSLSLNDADQLLHNIH